MSNLYDIERVEDGLVPDLKDCIRPECGGTLMELREQIAIFLYENFFPDRDENETVKSWEDACKYNKHRSYDHADQIIKIYKDAGWVELDDDQTLPLMESACDPMAIVGFNCATDFMFKQNWKKIK